MEDEVIELRMVLENLDEDVLVKILEINGYSIGGNQKKLINEIMTKVTHTKVVEDLKEMGLM
ncbi:MAG: hypothetical protein Q4P14_03885 [Methanobacteriaceae archaeon]|nr:hypothetical protein [Methanobacteriaceae archaeon]